MATTGPNAASLIQGEIDAFVRKSPRPVLHGAVIGDGRRVGFSHGLGDSGMEPLFEIGSVGKTFTTTLLAILVREGVVKLEDPVAKFRPQYPFASKVTLRHLASHTSGLPANPVGTWTMLTRARAFAESFRPEDLETFLRIQSLRPRRFGKFNYSNVGMSLLGHILAECLGMGYERAVMERVLIPLGMRETRIDRSVLPTERLVDGHDRKGRMLPPFSWRGMEPAGLWRSSVSDMIRFLRAQMGLEDPSWASLSRIMVEPCAKVGAGTQVGLGWMLTEFPGLGTVAWHTGGTFGQHSIVGWTLEDKRAIVILTNRHPPFWHHLIDSRSLEKLAEKVVALHKQGAAFGNRPAQISPVSSP
ncbi:MAG: beta-lactamase family protein [Fibrobacterota bacterium]|nr:beta-lactamase family protein [Fibrobacterota bacterium]